MSGHHHDHDDHHHHHGHDHHHDNQYSDMQARVKALETVPVWRSHRRVRDERAA